MLSRRKWRPDLGSAADSSTSCPITSLPSTGTARLTKTVLTLCFSYRIRVHISSPQYECNSSCNLSLDIKYALQSLQDYKPLHRQSLAYSVSGTTDEYRLGQMLCRTHFQSNCIIGFSEQCLGACCSRNHITSCYTIRRAKYSWLLSVLQYLELYGLLLGQTIGNRLRQSALPNVSSRQFGFHVISDKAPCRTFG